MSELRLIISADSVGLAEVKGATAALEALLKGGGASTASSAALRTEYRTLKEEIKLAKAELVSIDAAFKKTQTTVTAATKSLNLAKASFSQLATTSRGLTQALSLQNKELLDTQAQMAGMSRLTRKRAQEVQTLAGIEGLLNKEFALQVQLQTAVTAATHPQLAQEQARTKALATRLYLTKQMSAEDLKRLGITSAVIEKQEAAAIVERNRARSSAQLALATLKLEKGLEQQRTAGVAAGIAGRNALRTKELAVKKSTATASSQLALATLNLEKGLEQQRTAALAAGVKGREALRAEELANKKATATRGARLALATLNLEKGIEARRTAAIAAGAKLRAQSEALSQANQKLARSTRVVHDAMRGASGAAGSLWMTYGNLLPLMAGFITVATTIKGIGIAADFEFASRYTTALAEATGDYSVSLGELRRELLAVREVTQDPAELGEASKELVKAGFTTAEAVGEIGELSRTAFVAQEDLATVTRGVAAQYRAWNVEIVGADRGVRNMTQAANMMTYAAQATALDFGELNGMLAYTTELATTTGASFSEVLAGLGLLSDYGIRGTKAATSFRTAIQKLQNPTDALALRLSKLTVAFSAYTDDNKRKTITRLFDDLGKSLASLTEKARSEAIYDLFGLRGMKGGAIMVENLSRAVEEGTFSFRSLRESIDEVGVSQAFVSRLFAELADTTQGQFKLLSADIRRELIKAFDGKAVRSFIETVRGAVADGSFRSLLEALAEAASLMIRLVTLAVDFKTELGILAGGYALGKILGRVHLITKAVKELTLAQIGFNLATRLNPYILAGTAIAASIYGISKAIDEYKKLGKEATIAGEELQFWQQKKLTTAAPPEPGKVTAEIEKVKAPLAGTEEMLTAAQEKLERWAAQRYLNQLEVERKARISVRKAAAQDLLKVEKAKYDALLLTEQQYISNSRKIREDAALAEIADAETSASVLRKKIEAAKVVVRENKDDITAYKNLATLQDQLVNIEHVIEKLKSGKTITETLIDLEDRKRVLDFARALRSITDATEDIARASANTEKYATMGKAAAATAVKLDTLTVASLRAARALADQGASPEEIREQTQAYEEQKDAIIASVEARVSVEGDWAAGAQRGLRSYAEQANDTYGTIERASLNAAKSMEDGLLQALTNSEGGFRKLGDVAISTLNMIAQEMLRVSIVRPMVSGLAGIAGSLIGNLFTGGSAGYYDAPTNAGVTARTAHTGWRVGETGGNMRQVPESLFHNAPRLHNGLADDEYPAILQRGEEVNSRAQVAEEKRRPVVSGPTVHLTYAPVFQAVPDREIMRVIVGQPKLIIGMMNKAFNMVGKPGAER